MVLGTPGSGKTTVIINRIYELIEHYSVKPENILVITFTRAAALSMRERFMNMSDTDFTYVRFGTFHSFFYWIIRTAYGNNIEVIDEFQKKNVIKRIVTDVTKEYDNEDLVNSIISQMGIISCDMIDIENYYSRDISADDFRLIYKRYKEYKKENGLIDFDDMVSMCYDLLVKRPDILDSIRRRYPFIMVDEYQDTNLLQYEILKLLAHPLDNLYVVGDDDQSVYGFRGARPDIMRQFKKEFKGAEVMRLSYNFRCPENVVRLSDKIISGNKERYNKNLKAANDRNGLISITKVKEISNENELIVRRIRQAKEKGMDYKDIAVLYRTNRGPERLIYKLQEYSIPFEIKDVLPDIFSHPVVKPVINYIEFALGNNSRSVFLGFMNKPVRYISRDMLKSDEITIPGLLKEAKGKDYLEQNIRRLGSELRTITKLTPYAAVNYIREAIGYNKYLKKSAAEKGVDYDEMKDILDDFQSMVKDLENFNDFFNMIEDTRELLKKQAELNHSENSEPKDGVQLMTMHSAKGLEFRTVHIMDVYNGNIPFKKSKTPLEKEEERRLLYVAVTRCSDELYIYIPEIVGEKAVKPSVFLGDVVKRKRKS